LGPTPLILNGTATATCCNGVAYSSADTNNPCGTSDDTVAIPDTTYKVSKKEYTAIGAEKFAKAKGCSLASIAIGSFEKVVKFLGYENAFHVEGYNGVCWKNIHLIFSAPAIVPNPDVEEPRQAILDCTPQPCSRIVK